MDTFCPLLYHLVSTESGRQRPTSGKRKAVELFATPFLPPDGRAFDCNKLAGKLNSLVAATPPTAASPKPGTGRTLGLN